MLLLLEFSPIEKSLAATQPSVLVEFAGLLQKSIRESDAVARLDEEHFAIILDDVNNPDAGKIVAQKILDNLHDNADAPFRDKPYKTHIGISVFPDHGEDVMNLMRCANQAMLIAKESQARFLQFEPAMFESADILQ
jgi:diguanylate cyclase (GGDEF)-like protein